MIVKEIIQFCKHFSKGTYIKTIDPPYIHGFFTDYEKLETELQEIDEDRTLYFIAHKLKDIDAIPENSFGPIPQNGSIKKSVHLVMPM